jgi:hypothetical protein
VADRVATHVARFNAAVSSGDWDQFVAPFAEDAVLEFVNVPVGPYLGRDAIAAAYRKNPPDDTLAVRSVDTAGASDAIDFAWTKGGVGMLRLDWTKDGRIAHMQIEFGS